ELADLSVRVRRPAAGTMIAAPRSPLLAAAPMAAQPMPVSGSLHQVFAPLTGIWYDSPSPGASPYVEPGTHVAVGTPIGLIETMKIFNEIVSDAAGRVVQVHARRGDLVTASTP